MSKLGDLNCLIQISLHETELDYVFATLSVLRGSFSFLALHAPPPLLLARGAHLGSS
jgi:hypothetical protein